jgi:hypothetical protein
MLTILPRNKAQCDIASVQHGSCFWLATHESSIYSPWHVPGIALKSAFDYGRKVENHVNYDWAGCRLVWEIAQ